MSAPRRAGVEIQADDVIRFDTGEHRVVLIEGPQDDYRVAWLSDDSSTRIHNDELYELAEKKV